MNAITKVYLLNVPLENDYKHTLYFENATAQNTYFLSKKVKEYTNFTYQRKDGYIAIPANFDQLQHVNYIAYQNTAYSNKWFYAFVTDLKYINDGVTYIYIETDYIQTWLFNYAVKQSFVEREHVSTDTIGDHTIPENLELGEYVSNGSMVSDPNLTKDKLKIVIGSTEAPSGEGAFYGAQYNGIYSGVRYYTYTANNVTSSLQFLADNGKIDAVSSLFLAPDFILPQAGGGPISESDTTQSHYVTVPKITSLNGYTPRNNKLLTYPYCYIFANNNNGSSAIYHPNLFYNPGSSDSANPYDANNYSFKVVGALTPGCSIRMYPCYYKGRVENIVEGINLGKFPQCNWATDMYTNWLTQNGVNVATSLVGATVQTAVGAATRDVGGAIGGLSGIANSLNEVYKASLMPPQTSGNINCGDVITSDGTNNFYFMRMSIRKEYAQIIDKYFDMFGYKVNMVKTPNKNHRARYWYTKCIDVNIDGAIPMKDMQAIKDAYNRGITFWRNPAEIQDYSVSNGIV